MCVCMLSSTFPFIFNTAPLEEGQTFGDPDVRPEELVSKIVLKTKTIDNTSSSSSVVTESTASESDMNDSLNESSNSSLNTSLNSRESSHSASNESTHSIASQEAQEKEVQDEVQEEVVPVVIAAPTAAEEEGDQSDSTVVEAVEEAREGEMVEDNTSSAPVLTTATVVKEDAVVMDEEKRRLEEAEAARIAKKHLEAKEYFYKLHNGKVIKELISELESSIYQNRPEDVVQFSATYFTEKVNRIKALQEGPKPIVFAGPSGVGKGTIVNILMERLPSLFGFSVSHATRAPRPGEENGVHYNFVTVSEMEAAIANNEFIEYAHVHTNYYGSSYKAVDDVKSQGKICILDIDIQGVQNVKKSSLECEYIFIAPPSIEELEARLRGRGTETEEKIQVRMNNARGELAFGKEEGNFDLYVVNNDLETAVESILSHLKNKYPTLPF